MAIEIDLRNYKSIFSDRIEPGTYTVQIEDIDPNDKTKDGKKQMRVELRVLDGEAKNSMLIERLPLDQESKALFRTVGFLSALGIPTPRKKLAFDETKLVGRKLLVEVVDNEWNGRTSSQVSTWMKAAGATTAAADVDDMPEEDEEQPETAAAPETTDDLDIDLDNLDV